MDARFQLFQLVPSGFFQQLAIENGINSRGFAQQMVIFPSFLYVYHWFSIGSL
jgi:hypothetical protein